jgi:CRISPR-associated protein Cmr3
MVEHRLLHPLDVLYLRGNRLFGGPGDHGEALMPPWPSMAAGALRSRMLVDGGITDFAAFAGGEAPSGQLGSVLGTPDVPGTFRVADFTLGRAGEGGAVEPFRPLPADLVALPNGEGGVATVRYLTPASRRDLPDGVATSFPLDHLPLLRAEVQKKPVMGQWLGEKGWNAYLAGNAVAPTDLARGALWQIDPRLGIALDAAARTAGGGQIYTTDTIALADGVAFIVAVAGAEGSLPADGLVRLGGDGRAAEVAMCRVETLEPPWERIGEEGRFRIILTTPGIFPDGWRLPGMDENGVWNGPDGVTARVAAAAVPRHDVISGWDLAAGHPKQAQRVVPVGAVYWLEGLQGGTRFLRRLLTEGLWPLIETPDDQRRAEGFNNVAVAAWPSVG